MESKEESSSKGNPAGFWRECRVCREGNARSPGFKSFISLLNHLLEHQKALGKESTGLAFDRRTGNLMDNPAEEEKTGFQPKITSDQKAVLPIISYWLQLALRDLDYPSSQSVVVSEQLFDLLIGVPEEYSDQREYLLKYPELLKAIGSDPDWPRTAGLHAKFVADSLAGVQWGIQPSTSREYIRQANKQKVELPDLVKWALEDWFRESAQDLQD